MEISSPAFHDGEMIPDIYTCQGDNINPPLEIREVPGDAVSLVLVISDLDAPSGEFVHWAIWNIGRDTTRIDQGLPPANATEGRNGAGSNGYLGPCPPSGIHHYIFKLYALDRQLELDEGAGKTELENEMTGHVVDQAELIGIYGSR